jgi:hypothetical protein
MKATLTSTRQHVKVIETDALLACVWFVFVELLCRSVGGHAYTHPKRSCAKTVTRKILFSYRFELARPLLSFMAN